MSKHQNDIWSIHQIICSYLSMRTLKIEKLNIFSHRFWVFNSKNNRYRLIINFPKVSLDNSSEARKSCAFHLRSIFCIWLFYLCEMKCFDVFSAKKIIMWICSRQFISEIIQYIFFSRICSEFIIADKHGLAIQGSWVFSKRSWLQRNKWTKSNTI